MSRCNATRAPCIMALTPRKLLPWIGMVAWGDIGPITLYRDHRGATISFAKTFPQKPPTPAQLRCRLQMAQTGATWRALPPSVRDLLKYFARNHRMRGSGYNLWQHHRWMGFGSWLVVKTVILQVPIKFFIGPLGLPTVRYRPREWYRLGQIETRVHPLTSCYYAGPNTTERLWLYPWDRSTAWGVPIDIQITSRDGQPIRSGQAFNLLPLYWEYDTPATYLRDRIYISAIWPNGHNAVDWISMITKLT